MRMQKRNKKSKLVITFDAEKRKDYLLGFHKRKQERRRFGLDMGAYKEKKKQLELRKQKRAEENKLLTQTQVNSIPIEIPAPISISKTKFSDNETQERFGNPVTVTTVLGEIHSDDGFSCDDEISPAILPQKARFQPLSLFDHIRKKRRSLALPTKRSKKAQASRNRNAFLAKTDTKRSKTKRKPNASDSNECNDAKPNKRNQKRQRR